jgi:hypothetical protein
VKAFYREAAGSKQKLVFVATLYCHLDKGITHSGQSLDLEWTGCERRRAERGIDAIWAFPTLSPSGRYLIDVVSVGRGPHGVRAADDS